MYAATFERIERQLGGRANLAKRVLTWMVYTEANLPLQELKLAFATCPDTHTFDEQHIAPESLIVSVCCGLVTENSTTYPRLIREWHSTEGLFPKLTYFWVILQISQRRMP